MSSVIQPLLRAFGTLRQGLLQADAHGADQSVAHPFAHLAPDFADGILRQVRAEGYHVECLHTFMHGEIRADQAIAILQCWTASVGLRVSFNPAHGICFFESVHD